MNKKIGLALSGGGAKTLTQLQVIKILENRGIKPDIICGTSMGAVNAVLLACGYTADDLIKFYKNFKMLKLFTLSIGKNHLLSTLNLGKFIEKICKEKGYEKIEDLPIPISIGVTDVTTNKPVYLTKGSIKEAICATTAVIFMKEPVITDEVIKKQVCEQTGREYNPDVKIVLKDGCYTVNVPFDGLDLLRSDSEKQNYYDICLDVVPNFKKTYFKPLDDFNLGVWNNDQKRKEIFKNNYNGIYIELDCGIAQTDFNIKTIKKAIKYVNQMFFYNYEMQICKDLELINSQNTNDVVNTVDDTLELEA